MLDERMLAPAPPACHLISASLADTAQNNPEAVLRAKCIQWLQLLIGSLVIKSFSGPEGPIFHRQRHPFLRRCLELARWVTEHLPQIGHPLLSLSLLVREMG